MFQSYVSLPTGRSHVCVRSFWIPFWDDRSVREVFNDLVLARHVIYGHCGVLLVDDLISGSPKNSARWIGRRFPEGHHGHAWICGQAAVTQNVLSDPVSNAGPSNHKVSGSATWLTMDLSWFFVERSMYSCGCPHYRDLLSGLSSITQELCFSEKGIPSKSMCEGMFTYQRREHFGLGVTTTLAEAAEQWQLYGVDPCADPLRTHSGPEPKCKGSVHRAG